MIEDQYHIFSYYPKSAERNFELYEIEMDAGCEHSSIGHSSNIMEYVLVTEGRISLRVGEQEYFLETEDAMCFNASLPHCYINKNSQTAKVVLLIQYL